jgi:hypothetical protein
MGKVREREEANMGLVRQLLQIGTFIRAQRIQMRFGALSRAPLRLLRLKLEGNTAECDWVARPADEWDRNIPRQASELNVTTQALQDAIAIRDLLFWALPEVDTASLRVFRDPAAGERELIITGTVTREPEISRYVASVAMRAKLLGLQFWLEDGVLEALRLEEHAMSF